MGNFHAAQKKNIELITFGDPTIGQLLNEKAKRLSSHQMMLNVKCEVMTPPHGLQTIEARVYCKIMSSEELAATASEAFLDKPVEEIENMASEIVQHHLHANLHTLPIDEIYNDPDRCAKLVRESAKLELNNIFVEIMSLTICKPSTDHVINL